MAPPKEAVEFNQIIQAEREKKKKQQLADQILGSGRRSSALGGGIGKKPGSGPSLASRVGVSKLRAASNSPRPSFNNNGRNNDTRSGRPQARANIAQQRTVSTPHLNQRNNALTNLVKGGIGAQPIRNMVNVINPRQGNGGGISVRGAAATPTYTVIAQNFAIGTTASDIEAVLCPDTEEAGFIGCRLIASNPTVIAEVRLSNSQFAQDIVDKYNNQKADGRLLHVYLKDPPPAQRRLRQAAVNNLETMDVDDEREPYQGIRSAYDATRAAKGEANIQDGRFGFSDEGSASKDYYEEERQNNQYNRRGRGRGGNGGGLVSDNMLRRDNGYNRR